MTGIRFFAVKAVAVTSHEDAFSVYAKLPCPECGRVITTRQSGNTTRCPLDDGGCGALVYVPVRPIRSRVTLSCHHCPTVWETRARAGNVIKCPGCNRPRRVPAGIRRALDDSPSAPAPVRSRASRSTPSRPPRSVDLDPEEWEDDAEEGEEAPGAALLDALRSVSRMLHAPTVPTPRPAPVVRQEPPRTVPPPIGRPNLPTAPRPAPRRHPAPVSSPAAQARADERDRRRRDAVCSLVRSLSGPLLVRYDATQGMCEVLDTRLPRERQRCPGMASRAVVFVGPFAGEVSAYSCPAHADLLATMATASPGMLAQVVSRDV